MDTNNSLFGDEFLQGNVKIISVQILILLFLCINLLLIITFLKKECFHATARYLLFAVTLFSDSLVLIMSDILVIVVYFNITMPVVICIFISALVLVYITVTPVTLTAMTLERYVAICMPLHHGKLCSTRSSVHCILIIHGLSFIPCFIIFATFFASASLSFYKQYYICSVEMFTFDRWQSHLRTAIYQIQFLIMCIILVFAYVKILIVAKAASGENKRLTRKGLQTVVLHGFQLLLCLLQLWCPFIEVTILNYSLFKVIRYINYIMFYLAPKCLSPLIYGLRDETFFNALKYYMSTSLCKRKNPVVDTWKHKAEETGIKANVVIPGPPGAEADAVISGSPGTEAGVVVSGPPAVLLGPPQETGFFRPVRKKFGQRELQKPCKWNMFKQASTYHSHTNLQEYTETGTPTSLTSDFCHQGGGYAASKPGTVEGLRDSFILQALRRLKDE
ncbi:odorant receptor 131-2-like [Betta splendens]|uniref:Odorant receptor 131-2-like n=1 Tax=Betta splendens TaxID=158456 RepID=A0A9W2Y813_BETSP|nr:odorant receptor 131-2-like [Betta splendens]